MHWNCIAFKCVDLNAMHLWSTVYTSPALKTTPSSSGWSRHAPAQFESQQNCEGFVTPDEFEPHDTCEVFEEFESHDICEDFEAPEFESHDIYEVFEAPEFESHDI